MKRKASRGRGRAAPASDLSPAQLRSAAGAWITLDRPAQLALLQEILQTRRGEFVRAYANVIGVTLGYGTWRSGGSVARAGRAGTAAGGRAARRRASDVLGVTFLVRRKIHDPARLKDRAIPRHVLAYAQVAGRRVLCAIPTDVEAADELRPRAQAAPPTFVTPTVESTRPWTRGVLTAIVQPPAGPANRPQYAMSCRHVFGMSMDDDGQPTGRAVKRERRDGDPYADVSSFYGELFPDNPDRMSFDAALALISDENSARAALPARVDDYAASLADIPPRMLIHTARPRGQSLPPIRASQTHVWTRSEHFGIDYRRVGVVYHELVIEMLASSETLAGDSGSPVTNLAGNLLLGMHIAGSGNRAYMIPAYELMWSDNYRGLEAEIGQTALEFA